MSNPLKVHVEGPLRELVSPFREFLFARDYVPDTVARQLQLIGGLSRWMLTSAVTVENLSPTVTAEFIAARKLSHRNLRSPRALIPFGEFLDSVGVERREHNTVPSAPASELILGRFADYLTTDRALRSATVSNYLNQTRPFLRWCAGLIGEELATLQAKEITNYLLWRGATQSVGSIRVAATALRAFLAWTFLVRVIPVDLTSAIGPIAYSSYGGLPKALSVEQLALLEAEAAALRLDDIKWRLGTVLIHAKGGALQTMPLSADVGAALSDYLLHERPASTHRQVFLGATAPHAPLGRSGVSSVITSLGRHAGITSRIGAHRLRHGAASAVLSGGGTLVEAAQLLRHASVTTSFAAGVDVATIALWLGHESVESTRAYLHADLSIKQKALNRTAPLGVTPGSYQPPDTLIAFLENL
jgi:integrase/recombinase XerD